MLHLVIFTVFGAIALGGAINLLAQRHPINSALSLIVVMAALAVEYLLLGAEFVSVIQVIVYAGAIMVLFIFVIMLLNAGLEEHTKGSRVALILGLPGLIVGLGVVAWLLLERSGVQSVPAGGNNPGYPRDIGFLLFKNYLLPFEVTSVLILIAIMGAVVLASPTRGAQEKIEYPTPPRGED
jgi:NADH-quinone oxidoreductase subunit J